MIFEALSTIQDANGLDVNAILNFIEERYEIPQNYRRAVSSKLRRLGLVGELEKVGNRFKYKMSGQEAINVKDMNEGKNVLARMIARSENTEQAAIKARKKMDSLEESIVMLKIAEEIHERCSKEGSVVLNL